MREVWRLEFGMYSDIINTRVVICSIRGMEGFAGLGITKLQDNITRIRFVKIEQAQNRIE